MNAVDILKFGQQTVLQTIVGFLAIQTFGHTMTPKARNFTFLGRRIEREIGLLRTNFASSLGQTMGKVTSMTFPIPPGLHQC